MVNKTCNYGNDSIKFLLIIYSCISIAITAMIIRIGKLRGLPAIIPWTGLSMILLV